RPVARPIGLRHVIAATRWDLPRRGDRDRSAAHHPGYARVCRGWNLRRAQPQPQHRPSRQAHRLVWAVTFEGDSTICPPPPGATCATGVPGVATAFLDYYTGDFILGGGGSG